MTIRFATLLLLLLPLLLAIHTNAEQQCETPGQCTADDKQQQQKEDPKCPSRPLIVRCAEKHLDTNRNGKLDREELETAIDKLPWLARGVLKVIGSVDKIMEKCDVDKDGAISIDYDMSHNEETCLASCFKRRAFRNAFFPDCE